MKGCKKSLVPKIALCLDKLLVLSLQCFENDTSSFLFYQAFKQALKTTEQ